MVRSCFEPLGRKLCSEAWCLDNLFRNCTSKPYLYMYIYNICMYVHLYIYIHKHTESERALLQQLILAF